MSILDRNTVDFVQVNEADKTVRLIVSDHLPWGSGDADDQQHLYDLQEKLNAYLTYIESGQLFSEYPNVKGLRTLFQVYGKFDRPSFAIEFYAQLRRFLNNAGYDIEFILKD